MSEEKENPEVTNPTKVQDSALGMPFLFGIGATLLIVGLVIWFKWFHVAASTEVADASAQRIVVINTSKIIVAATKQAMANPNVAEAGGKLSVKLAEAINEYRLAGVLVLNGYSVISAPPEMDKTAEVAAKVGVKLE